MLRNKETASLGSGAVFGMDVRHGVALKGGMDAANKGRPATPCRTYIILIVPKRA